MNIVEYQAVVDQVVLDAIFDGSIEVAPSRKGKRATIAFQPVDPGTVKSARVNVNQVCIESASQAVIGHVRDAWGYGGGQLAERPKVSLEGNKVRIDYSVLLRTNEAILPSLK